jgi:threonylcarbamoyladenosine tRNA methylthiotransferase CDKAL1
MIEDIEDCAGAGHAHPSPRRAVLPRALRPRRRRTPEEAPQSDSFIPGTQSVYLKTWGCSHNTSDGEYMAGMLAAAGYTITGISSSLLCLLKRHYFYSNPPLFLFLINTFFEATP